MGDCRCGDERSIPEDPPGDRGSGAPAVAGGTAEGVGAGGVTGSGSGPDGGGGPDGWDGSMLVTDPR